MPLPLGLHGQHNMFQENCIRRKNSFLLHHEHDDYTCTMYPFVLVYPSILYLLPANIDLRLNNFR